MAENNASFTFEDGKLYGNRAAMGNDAFINYDSKYKTSELFLKKPADIFFFFF